MTLFGCMGCYHSIPKKGRKLDKFKAVLVEDNPIFSAYRLSIDGYEYIVITRYNGNVAVIKQK